MDEKTFNELANMLGNYSSNNFSDSNNINNSECENDTHNNFNFSNLDFSTIAKFKTVFDKMNSKKNNDRTKLLMSLKPYLKPSKREKLDQYMNLTNVLEIFNSIGGDNIK